MVEVVNDGDWASEQKAYTVCVIVGGSYNQVYCWLIWLSFEFFNIHLFQSVVLCASKYQPWPAHLTLDREKKFHVFVNLVAIK